MFKTCALMLLLERLTLLYIIPKSPDTSLSSV